MAKRPVHKRRPQSGRGFVQCGHFSEKGGGGFCKCGRPQCLVQKNFGFFEFFGVSARTRVEGGWASADILRTKGVNFSRFCADVFYGRTLSS